MGDQEFVIAIIAITMTGGVLIVGISKIVDLIKSWINRNNSNIPEEQFNRLAKAFVEYKKDTTQRIQHLESIIGDEDMEQSSSDSRGIEPPGESIETDDDREPKKEQSQQDDNNLRNMLRE